MQQFLKLVADKPKPILLYLDNHGSHFDFKTFFEALKNDVHIVGIPPHASHVYQPLDVGVFKDLKIILRKILRKILRTNRLLNVTKEMFPGVLKQLWEQLRPSYLVSGFRGAGLCPFNPNEIDKRKFLPSVTVTKAPTVRRTHGSLQTSSASKAAPSISITSSSVSGLPMIVVR